MAQTKITSKSLAPLTVAASNIADGAIETRHIAPAIFSPVIFSDKINSSTGYFTLPSGTTAQRPISPPNGAVRYNTTLGYFEWYDSMSTLWLRMDEQKPSYVTTGGTITTITDPDDGLKYRCHTFTSPATYTLTFERSGYIDFLLVGGGGSGGNHSTTNANGGGGGGGVIFKKNHFVTNSSYTLSVGVGGAAIGYQIASAGNNGSNSSIVGSLTNYVALGGGGGGASATAIAKDGGSGGGRAWNSSGDRGRSIQAKYLDAQSFGNAGGRNWQAYTGSGGGGASSEGIGGYDANSVNNGDGGYGIQFGISGTKKYYGGGGGGGGDSSQRAGDGWHGGGRGFGATSYYTNKNYPIEVNTTTLGSGTPDGVDGTGGGGGAGSYWSNNSTNWLNKGSGKGGDGIIIIRYRIP